MKRPIMTFILVLAVSIFTLTAQPKSLVTAKYVGIGIDNPAYRLHLFENSSEHMYLNFSNLTTGNSSGDGVLVGIDPNEDFRIHSYEDNDLRFHTNDMFRMILKNDGKLGLGIENPLSELHIMDNEVDADNDAVFRLQSRSSNNDVKIEFYENTAAAMSLHYDGGVNKLFLNDLTQNPIATRVTFDRAGNLGINTTNPSEGFHLHNKNMIVTDGNLNNAIRMDVNSAIGAAGEISLFDTDGDQTVVLRGAESINSGASLSLRNASGLETIELDAEHGGVGRVITDELEIKGGSDLSEYFDIDNEAEFEILPGMVVSISPDGSGNLRLSTIAYDKTVAGVISGANGVRTGLMMGQESSIAHGDTPVVLAGRAYVWADATFGSIQPGDLLTTSSKPGHVMKVTDYQEAQGAIIGKAMTKLGGGTGYVLVLVNLQ